MLLIKQFAIILFFYALGELISYFLPFTFPGSIIGMVLLFLALSLKLLKIEDIKQVSDFFLKHMSLFFIPAGVSMMSSFELIEAYLVTIVLVLTFSTIFMLAFISLMVDFFVQRVENV